MAKKRKRKYSRSSGRDVESEMRRYKRGTARSGRGGKGGKVKSRKQAIAIGLSKARKKGKKVPRKNPKKILRATVMQKSPSVATVAASNKHTFRKEERNAIRLIAGHGVQEDAHCGPFVQHLYDKAKDAARPNLRQVHLIEEELVEHLQTLGFDIKGARAWREYHDAESQPD
jgi:hypothetical protein